jgi:hypothetical protein
MAFYLMFPQEVATYGASVTTSSGATDSDYDDDRICSGWPGKPARATNGTVTWSATFTSAEVGMIVVANCNANVNATIGGGVSTSVVAGALGANGIRLNGFTTVTPANQTNLTVGFSGASAAVVLGEFIAGKYRTFTAPHFDSPVNLKDFARDPGAEFSSIAPYDPKLEQLRIVGKQIYTTADRDLIIECFRGQRANTRPTVMVLDSTVNHAWVGFLDEPTYVQAGPGKWDVTIAFTEIPRSRW